LNAIVVAGVLFLVLSKVLSGTKETQKTAV